MQNTGSLYGAERATLELARHVQSKGLGVCIYLITEIRLELKESPLVDYCRRWNLSLREFPVETAFSNSLIQTLRNTLVSDGVNVLHTVGYKPTFHGGWAVNTTQVKFISTVHGWLFRKNFRERAYGWLERWMLKRCSRVIVLSRYYENLLHRYGFSPHQVQFIPTGIELVEPGEEAEKESVKQVAFGFAGRLSEEKRPADFVEAAKRCLQGGMDAEFFLAGDGPLLSNLKANAEKDRIGFLGFIPTAEVFKRIDILVNTSQMENLPYSILEAMARGFPVIASAAGGTPDLVEHNHTGFLYPVGDIDALVECMKLLAGDSDLRRSLGQEGQKKIEKEFSLDRCVQEHVELYRSIMQPNL